MIKIIKDQVELCANLPQFRDGETIVEMSRKLGDEMAEENQTMRRELAGVRADVENIRGDIENLGRSTMPK